MPVYDISIELRVTKTPVLSSRVYFPAMNSNGFRHSISDDSDKSYWLPRDVFTYQGDISKQELMDAVYNLLTEFVPAPGVMVTESVGRCWRGLREIEDF